MTVRRLLAIPKLAVAARRRERKKEVQSAAVKVVFGRVKLEPTEESFSPVSTQFKSLAAMSRGFGPVQQWKSILRQCGVIGFGKPAHPEKFAKYAARAIADEDLINLPKFVSYGGYKFPEEDFRGRISKMTKCEQADRVCLNLARTQVFEQPQSFIKCRHQVSFVQFCLPWT